MSQDLVRLTKRFSFEMGHALHNYDGNCRFVHGHSYKLYVTVMGKVKHEVGSVKDGMVIDFSVLKKIVKDKIVETYDHALVVSKHDTRDFKQSDYNERIIFFDNQPTCENLLIRFKEIIQDSLPQNLTLANVKLYETEDSYAEWDIRDQKLTL